MRRALGFPQSLYEEFFGEFAGLQIAKATLNPLGNSTPFYVECEIALDHRLTLQQYKKLPRRERYVWYLYKILANKKEQFAYDEIKREHEAPVGDNRLDRMRDYM